MWYTKQMKYCIQNTFTLFINVLKLKKIFILYSTEYIKIAFLYVMKNGRTGDVWIAENKQPPRLSNMST